MNGSTSWARALGAAGVALVASSGPLAVWTAAARAPVAPYEVASDLVPGCEIDRLVFEQCRRLGIDTAYPCSDGVFVRRIYLDLIGTLPTAREAWDFLSDRAPEKRRLLIDRLMGRPEFVEYWTLKWCDLLRVKAEFPINLWPNAVQAYHRWIRAAVGANMPVDRFARELLTASGSNFRTPQVNFYRALQSREPWAHAQVVALTFMGERVERWPAERLRGMSGFFTKIGYKETAEWKEEIVFFDPTRGAQGPAPVYPDGTPARLGPDDDPRHAFADWLLAPGNPAFARNVANRAWYWLVGRGIIHEPDDFRADNPPGNPELLAWLERELVSCGYDLRHLFRAILNSKVYQLSSIPGGPHPSAEAHFAHYPIRRLDAEVLIDALCQITGTTEEYSSQIPEPFTFIPAGQRSIALADGSISSTFLEMFGRPPRDSGLESERNNRATAAQILHLLNSRHVESKIEEGANLRALAAGATRPAEAIARIYLAILSRLPTPEEAGEASALGEGAGRERALTDLCWALINSAEFLHRH